MYGMDPMTIRDLLIWIGFALLSAILVGAVPSWMRCGAKRADPSVAAALFTLVLGGACLMLLLWKGNAAALLTLDTRTYLWLALCGLIQALVWLSLFTALTGGTVSKVFPVYASWYLIWLTASHFLYGTPLGLWKICCVVLILLGVVLIESRAGSRRSGLWFVYALLATLGAAGIPLLKRGLIGEAFDDTLFQAATSLIACVILSIFALSRGKQRTMDSMGYRAWVGIPMAALFLAGSYACDYLASLRGDWSILSPIAVLGFAFTMLFARLFQKEKQSGSAVFGTVLVLLGQFAILMGF